MASIRENRTSAGTCTYTVRFRHDGKASGRNFTTHADAVRWLAEVDAIGITDALNRLDGPAPTVALPTVAEWVRRYIDERTAITDGTRSDYDGYLRRDLAPAFGDLRLDALRRVHVAAWVNEQARAGRASKTIRHRHALLSAALKIAHREGLVVANVAEGIAIPRDDHNRVEMTVLTQAELAQLLTYIEPCWHPLIALLVGTGMRWGEATALLVRDVDLVSAQPTVRVRQAWKHTDGHGWALGSPKSRRSLRTVSLGAGVVRAVRPLVDSRAGDQYVITNKQGEPVRQNSFWTRVWMPAVAMADGQRPRQVPRWGPPPPAVGAQRLGKRPRVHDLRHTHASMLIAAGASLIEVQRRLGHESISTTEAVYTHLAPDVLARGAHYADAALGDVFPIAALESAAAEDSDEHVEDE